MFLNNSFSLPKGFQLLSVREKCSAQSNRNLEDLWKCLSIFFYLHWSLKWNSFQHKKTGLRQFYLCLWILVMGHYRLMQVRKFLKVQKTLNFFIKRYLDFNYCTYTVWITKYKRSGNWMAYSVIKVEHTTLFKNEQNKCCRQTQP